MCENISLDSAFLADSLIGLIHCLEFLLCCLLDIFSKSGYLVRVILDCHLTICLLHLVIGSFRSDFENAIVAVIAWTELGKD